jgi:hypothetical protein
VTLSVGIVNAKSSPPGHQIRSWYLPLLLLLLLLFQHATSRGNSERKSARRLPQPLRRPVMWRTMHPRPCISHRDWHPNTTLAGSVTAVADLAARNQECTHYRLRRRKISLLLHAKLLLVTRADQRRSCLCEQQRIVLSGETRLLFVHLSCAQ